MKKWIGLIGLIFLLNARIAAAAMTFDLDTIVITASRIAQHGYKVASNVSVIDQEAIEASGAQSIADILRHEMGVHLYDNSTVKTTSIDIRGFGDTATRNVLVLVNDRRVNPADISGPDISQISLGSVERIEIIRGGGSVLYGDNAVGGVVNIITKEGEGDLEASLGTVFGSYQTSGADLEISGAKAFEWAGLDNEVSYYLFSKYHDTKGYRKNSNVLIRDFNARLGYKLSDRVKVSLNTAWHEDDYGLPGGLSQTELETLGRRGSGDLNDRATTKDRFVQLVLDVDPWPEDMKLGRAVFDFSYRNRDTWASFAAFDFNTKREIDSYGFNGKYIFDETLFGQDFNFVSGIDYYNNDNDILGSGSNTDDLTISKEEFGAYVFAEYEPLENLYVNAGTRFQEADYTFDQKAAVVSYNTQSPQESVSQFGMKYEYSQGSNVFVSAQQTFRFLATDEWYNSFSGELNLDLKPQTGLQYEAGWRHNIDDTVVVSVTPYWMDLKNEIFFDPDSGFFGSNNNYDKTRRVGVEIGQKANLLKLFGWEDVEDLDQLDFSMNYTYQNPKFNGGANDEKFIPMAPEYQANFGLEVGFLEHFGVSLNGRYVGSRFVINDTTNVTPPIKPYFVVDTKLSFERDPFEVYVALNNLFNEKYFSFVAKSVSSTTRSYYPAPERNVTVGAKVKF